MFAIDIHPLIMRHGYAAVFLIVMLEGAGSPLPGETALVLAAVYAGATGRLDIFVVIAVAVAGAIVGGSLGFWFGRSVGAGFLERYGGFIGLNANRLALGRYLFERQGGKIIFFGRFVAVLRVVAALLAGVNKYDWKLFFFFNAAGALAWATIMGFAAYKFGDLMTRVTGPLGIAVLVLAVGSILVFWLLLRRHEKRMEEKLTAVALREKGSDPSSDRRDKS